VRGKRKVEHGSLVTDVNRRDYTWYFRATNIAYLLSNLFNSLLYSLCMLGQIRHHVDSELMKDSL